jgi:hypothetical protein
VLGNGATDASGAPGDQRFHTREAEIHGVLPG